MDNKTIYKLLTSNNRQDVILGYEYFTQKFYNEILRLPTSIGKNGKERHMSQTRVSELLGIRTALGISWSEKYIKNYERENS